MSIFIIVHNVAQITFCQVGNGQRRNSGGRNGRRYRCCQIRTVSMRFFVSIVTTVVNSIADEVQRQAAAIRAAKKLARSFAAIRFIAAIGAVMAAIAEVYRRNALATVACELSTGALSQFPTSSVRGRSRATYVLYNFLRRYHPNSRLFCRIAYVMANTRYSFHNGSGFRRIGNSVHPLYRSS